MVRTIGDGNACVLQLAVTGGAEQFVGAEHRTRFTHGAVFRTQVRAIGIHRRRQCRIVIDDEDASILTGQRTQGARLLGT